MIDKKKLVSIQKELCSLVACPGREQTVADYIYSAIKPFTDDVEIDNMGNVLARKNGKNKSGKKILLDAHMDEVGFIISHIDQKGFLKVAPMGGIDPAILPGTPVQFINSDGEPVIGVFCHTPPHLSKQSDSGKPVSFDSLAVDLGVCSISDIEQLKIAIGHYGTFYSPFLSINDTTVLGKAFDDRCGCAILLYIAELLSGATCENTILFSFSVMEEHRQLGAGTAAAKSKPDIALVIEATTATDTAGIPDNKVITSLQKGPAVTIADGSHIVPQRLITTITRCADRNAIQWQYKKPMFGGTNAREIAGTATGIPTAVIAVPCRYIHGPLSMLDIDDFKNTAQLVYLLCNENFTNTKK